MAVGNVVGSNIFNILLILCTAAVISPIGFMMANFIDIIVLIAFSVLVLLLYVKRKRLSRSVGVLMLILYAVYLVYICLRDTGALAAVG